MKTMSNRPRWLLLLFVFALVVAACADETADSTTTSAVEEPSTTTAGGASSTSAAPVASAMTITYDITPEAVWSDGTPITVADFVCTWNAFLNTPGSLSTSGYLEILSVEPGSSDKQVVIEFGTLYAPYKNLFNIIIPAHIPADCNDISADFLDGYPVSGRPWQLESHSADQTILVPNEEYWGDDPAGYSRLVQVPRAPDVETTALQSGEVDFIFPQAFAGITDALNADNIEYVPGYGTNYEGLYFQQGEDRNGPFADDVFREAFSKSVDRDFILANIYDPIFPGSALLQCGLWVPTIGDWCDDTQFEGSYDPEGAAALLEGDGWTMNGDGFWEKDGVVPEIVWRINAGNTRRESTQALMIPVFAEHGFNVVPDNPPDTIVFTDSLPAGDFDLAMFIQVAQPDPTVTPLMSCEQIPSEENQNQGQNYYRWCNEEVSALMDESDQNLDEASRVDQIHQIGQALVDDFVMLPLFQFPNVAAWRTDRIEGDAPSADASNYRAFNNSSHLWTPIGKDEIVVGAEQWPTCINPVTDCSSSSWMVWTVTFPVLPGVWDTTNTGEYVATNLVTAEPTVTENG